MTTAYTSTSVPVSRSQEAIRKLLINFDVRGVQFSEDFIKNKISIKFAKQVGESFRTVSVSMIVPEPPKIKRRSKRSKSNSERKEQMTRATYRALHDWLKSQFVAIDYGLLSFEDVFLSHFEWMLPDGEVLTVGEIIKPKLNSGDKLLPMFDDDILEGKVE